MLFVLDEEQTGEYDFVEFLRGIVLLVKSEGTRRMSSQEVAYLRTIFERNDKHGTGMVDGMDLQYMIQDVGLKARSKEEQQNYEKIMRAAENNKESSQGVLGFSFAAFLRFMNRVYEKRETERRQLEERVANQSGFSLDELEEFREVFQQFHRGASNESLGKSEVREILQLLGQRPTQAEIKQMFDLLDEDGTGSLDFIGFLRLMALQSDRVNS